MKFSLPTILFLLIAPLAVSLALPGSALADGGEGGLTLTQTVSGYTVNLIFQSAPAIGENPIHIQILDAAGMPVSGADVEVSLEAAESGHAEAPTEIPADSPASMPGMDMETASTPAAMSNVNSMSPVNPSAAHEAMGMTALEPGAESGEYKGELALESDGDLAVRAHITLQGKLMEVDFPLQVAKSNAGASALAVYASINAIILGTAFVVKQKSGSVKLSTKA